MPAYPTEVHHLHQSLKIPRRPSIASARSCISTRVGAVIEAEARHPENCGMRFTKSTNISVARAHARHRAGMRVRTAVTEGTANFLVNRRMNKSQQMRWSRRGADLVLQVRCAVYNGDASVPASVNGSNPSAVQMQLSQSPRDPTSFWTLPNTSEGRSSRPEGLEPHHRSHLTLDRAVLNVRARQFDVRARTLNLRALSFKRSADADIWYLDVMGMPNAGYWSRRAARMRQRAEHVADLDQRVGMLETAQHTRNAGSLQPRDRPIRGSRGENPA